MMVPPPPTSGLPFTSFFKAMATPGKNALLIELRNMAQGDTPVNIFCQRIKAIGDELHELGDTISDF
jgi:hypothetical protein